MFLYLKELSATTSKTEDHILISLSFPSSPPPQPSSPPPLRLPLSLLSPSFHLTPSPCLPGAPQRNELQILQLSTEFWADNFKSVKKGKMSKKNSNFNIF
jgi:hypothetical protein